MPDTRFSFSNFQSCEVQLDGLTYPTVEHAYQAAKTTDARLRNWVRSAPSATVAKQRGQRVPLRVDWMQVREQIMADLLRQKFGQAPYRFRLLSYQGPIVELNTWHDNTWGICTCQRCPGEGQNLLGKLLEQIRDELLLALEEVG